MQVPGTNREQLSISRVQLSKAMAKLSTVSKGQLSSNKAQLSMGTLGLTFMLTPFSRVNKIW